MNDIFFKTRLCANFMFRSCRNGENCSYAHGKEELRQPPPNWQELQWQQLGGNRDTAKFMNDSWKKRESAAITIRTIGNNLEGSKTVTKPPRGTYWKTKICPKSKHTRSCTYGDDCNFAHGDAAQRLSSNLVHGGFFDSHERQLVKGWPPWRRHRLQWHVYKVNFLSSVKFCHPPWATPILLVSLLRHTRYSSELQVPGGGGIEAEAAVTMTNSTKSVTPTLRTTRSSANYAPTLPDEGLKKNLSSKEGKVRGSS
ncbi:hypothetical protein KIW84_062567 [Lathyrus oleraceus]|uniref:C3H1-type domain-containing protein n=1 Tax=Pisum sativum TaxID=3888 RepID=A0A9D4W789_PEA|nr:hypothetical protein KIW84_062567 [Pisum sativum]